MGVGFELWRWRVGSFFFRAQGELSEGEGGAHGSLTASLETWGLGIKGTCTLTSRSGI